MEQNMRVLENDRGFRKVVAEKYQNEPGEFTGLIAESSAIGDYDDSMEMPGSSYLWVGQDHHLNREEIADLIVYLQSWLRDKRLPLSI